MENRDLEILKCLERGLQINEIALYLQKEKAIKVSISTIEKRLTAIRRQYGAKTLFQLGAILKAKKLI
ncbi:helix-turn-helix domain-containing protein [Chryseobacterium turcicum]|uniref:Uncharacterized protein n=1 Tax=Chryseobacterium turcicum TaxID=2898076 RepID=A0A9Q3V3X7_9FLAO|nr:hypothetical protein [Chryseobacterium turcicum]MCD1119178.1 hypothetical protein [Chryseobacterium turcicum]